MPISKITPASMSQVMTLGTAQASTSGTSIDFTGIPSWAKRITVMFNGVSTSGTSIPQVVLGTSSGFEITGYVASVSGGTSGVTTANSTTAFPLAPVWAGASIFNGHSLLTLVSGNIWVMSHNGQNQGFSVANGTKTLSGTLDRVRITTVNGTDTFDAGSINILYEG